MTSQFVQLKMIIKAVVSRYGYRNLLLEKEYRQDDAVQRLAARRAVIEEVMRITGLDYGEVYTGLTKLLRSYLIRVKGNRYSHVKTLRRCCICGRPILVSKAVGKYCNVHRGLIRIENLRRWRQRRKRGESKRQNLDIRPYLTPGVMDCLREMVRLHGLGRILKWKYSAPRRYAGFLLECTEQLTSQFNLPTSIARIIVFKTIDENEAGGWEQMRMF